MLFKKLTVIVLLVGLTVFSSTSNSRSYRFDNERNDPETYNVELIGRYGQIETDETSAKSKIAAVGIEIFFDDIDTRSKPYAYAAFLNKKSSLALVYAKSETDVETVNAAETIEDTTIGFGLNIITEESNYILGFIYASGDTTGSEGTDLAESDLWGVNIGKYIDDSSAIELAYTQSTIETIANLFIPSSEMTTDTATLSYENLFDIGGDKFIFLGLSASQIKNEAPNIDETNQEYELFTEFLFTRKASLFASAELNSGDDQSDEGRTISAGGTYFMTTKFAVNVILSQFVPKDDLVQEETSAYINGILRF